MARLYVLVNGSVVDFVNYSQGLRQMDPLFLLLFVVVTKLSKMISIMVNNGSLAKFLVNRGTLNIFSFFVRR